MFKGILFAEREKGTLRVFKGGLFFVLAAAMLAASPVFSATLTGVSGQVHLNRAKTKSWIQITAKKTTVSGGDKIRTGKRSRATIHFEGGSRIEIGQNGSFTLEGTGPTGSSIFMNFGFMKAWVAKRVNRHFLIRTPTAVCSVRGTHFSVEVDRSGMTRVAMFEGLLNVSDGRGNEVLLRENQSIGISGKGLGSVKQGEASKSESETRRDQLKREVGLEMTKEQVQSAAAIEAKNAIFQQGKAIIDVNGDRVRIEEYIIRPTPNQFKLVVLNDRISRFDYFYYTGTFNKTLPDDISIAMRQLPGCIGVACEFFLTGFETGRSNTIDTMVEISLGGHLVDVNNNGAGVFLEDDVSAAFNPGTDNFIALAAGTPFFKTLFNTNTLKFNGVEHASWKPKGGVVNIGNFVKASDGGDVDFTFTTTVQTPANSSCGPPNCTFTEDGIIHQVVYAQNATGTIWEKYDSFIIDNEGKVAKTEDFAGITSGTQFKKTLLDWNFQTIVTASEFEGRKIDLAVEPKIFIQSGLIQ